MGDLVLASHQEGFAEVEIAVPEETSKTEFRPTHLMEQICLTLEKHGPLSANKIEALIKGKAVSIRQARILLQVDGYVSDGTPHTLLKAWQGDAT